MRENTRYQADDLDTSNQIGADRKNALRPFTLNP
jgi:hypothetical protein